MRRSAVALLVATLALTGCAAHPALPPPTVDGRPLPSRAALGAALQARRAALRSLRAWARLSYEAPEESRRAKQLLLVERPDRLRMEVFSPFGAVFVLTTAGGRLAAWDRAAATVYRGAASAENLDRYTQVDLPVPIAVDLLLATPPLDDSDGVVSADGTAVKLWQETDGGVTATWFAADSLDPLRVEHQAADGRVELRAAYDGWNSVDGVRVPTALTLELPETQRRIGIALTEIEVNPPLPAMVFELATPAGAREVGLDGAPP
ncbi:MAG: DUF4292 domain-containing protein [bacterium]